MANDFSISYRQQAKKKILDVPIFKTGGVGCAPGGARPREDLGVGRKGSDWMITVGDHGVACVV